MRYFLPRLLLLLALPCTACCQANTGRLLNELNRTIADTAKYDAGKRETIAFLKRSFFEKSSESLSSRFNAYQQLFEENKVFNYDYPYNYSKKIQETALQLRDPSSVVSARLNLGFSLLSSGMFKETLDSLNKIDIRGVPDSVKAGYYALMGRYYYDLGDFDNDTYNTPAYNEKGNSYMDSA